MTPIREIKALLHALERLYSGMASRVLYTRMGTYRRRTGALADRDLAALLSDHLDRLAAAKRANSGEVPQRPVRQGVPEGRRELFEKHHPAVGQVSVVGRAFDGLGRYFKSSRTEPVLDPELSEKLRNSTWHHIHTALRLARQGEAKTAKLHLDIASQALKEVAHYMSGEDYIAFTVEVEEKLAEITHQGMGPSVPRRDV
jgi:hypothetical protein